MGPASVPGATVFAIGALCLVQFWSPRASRLSRSSPKFASISQGSSRESPKRNESCATLRALSHAAGTLLCVPDAERTGRKLRRPGCPGRELRIARRHSGRMRCRHRGGTSRPSRRRRATTGDCAQAETHWKATVEIQSVSQLFQDHLARFPDCAFTQRWPGWSIEALGGDASATRRVPGEKAPEQYRPLFSSRGTKTAQLKAEAEKIGTPRVAGSEQIAGQAVPSLYFGETKINNNIDIIADLAARVGGNKIAIYVRGTATNSSSWQRI